MAAARKLPSERAGMQEFQNADLHGPASAQEAACTPPPSNWEPGDDGWARITGHDVPVPPPRTLTSPTSTKNFVMIVIVQLADKPTYRIPVCVEPAKPISALVGKIAEAAGIPAEHLRLWAGKSLMRPSCLPDVCLSWSNRLCRTIPSC